MRALFLLLLLTFGDSLPVKAADSAPSLMDAGRKLYIAKCARCHKFYDPAKYSDKAWREWMDKMSKKAKLKPDQKEILSKYLDTFRTAKTNQPPSAPPH